MQTENDVFYDCVSDEEELRCEGCLDVILTGEQCDACKTCDDCEEHMSDFDLEYSKQTGECVCYACDTYTQRCEMCNKFVSHELKTGYNWRIKAEFITCDYMCNSCSKLSIDRYNNYNKEDSDEREKCDADLLAQMSRIDIHYRIRNKPSRTYNSINEKRMFQRFE